jgi:hypothetical protein
MVLLSFLPLTFYLHSHLVLFKVCDRITVGIRISEKDKIGEFDIPEMGEKLTMILH